MIDYYISLYLKIYIFFPSVYFCSFCLFITFAVSLFLFILYMFIGFYSDFLPEIFLFYIIIIICKTVPMIRKMNLLHFLSNLQHYIISVFCELLFICSSKIDYHSSLLKLLLRIYNFPSTGILFRRLFCNCFVGYPC